ncbi:hypothetical protein AMECASPLE_036606 [Ameca splendens]|uniref:Uncharacterized protein n=1 Tax=Ameca splendens TaxID=208324 RepID=A0ABV0YJ34_9TELE
MHQLGNWAGQANRSRPSTSHQPPQSRHKTCFTALPTRTPTVALRPARGKIHRRKHWRKATTARQGQGIPPTQSKQSREGQRKASPSTRQPPRPRPQPQPRS